MVESRKEKWTLLYWRVSFFLLATFFYAASLYLYYSLTENILGYKPDAVVSQALEPACQNVCAVSIPQSSVDKFNSFPSDGSQVLFVHFSGYNLSFPQTSKNMDYLDPLNLVWTESIEAPFLSLDLDFNVYSLTTLSRNVQHMTVKVGTETLNCMQNVNMSKSCVIANFAGAYFNNVTKQKGVLCYAVNNTNTVRYRCCRANIYTERVKCDIPATLSPEMATIFRTIVCAALIAILCFPYIFDILAYKENPETLCSNTQVCNPLSQFAIRVVQALGYYSTKHYWVNVLRKVLIGFAVPVMYYVYLGFAWYTFTYEIPKMFNESVKETWFSSKLSISATLLVILGYNVGVVCLSLIPRTEDMNIPSPSTEEDANIIELINLLNKPEKLNWMQPYYTTKTLFYWLKPRTVETSCFFSRRFAVCLFIFVLILSPVIVIIIFVGYAVFVSPLGKTIRYFCYSVGHFQIWIEHQHQNTFYRRLQIAFFPLSFFLFGFVFPVTMLGIFFYSLLFTSKLIVYLWIGVVANKDHYFPLLAVCSIFVYYSWSCLRSVAMKYQKLLKQTYEVCKEHQGPSQPSTRKALTFDNKQVPRISFQLFKIVIDDILPISEVYTNMILKLTLIILFLCLTFSSILIFETSNLHQSTRTLVLFLTALVPKLLEIFSEGSSFFELREIENACRIEKIVKDFLSQNDDDSHDVEQLSPSHPSGYHFRGPPVNASNELALEEVHECNEPIHSDANNTG